MLLVLVSKKPRDLIVRLFGNQEDLPGMYQIFGKIREKTSLLGCHSSSLLLVLDSVSATVFSTPGKCTAVIYLFRSEHQSQIALVIMLQATLVLPKFLIHATAEPLTVRSEK